MGTRSVIGVLHGNVCKSVYCHWDGYLDYNGRILQEHYDSTKANHLVAMGDISSLGPVIGQEHPFSELEISNDDPDRDRLLALHKQAKDNGWTTFYGRDRGEENVTWSVTHSFDEFLERVNAACAEYYYVMRDGVWYVGTVREDVPGLVTDGLVPLASALQRNKEVSE